MQLVYWLGSEFKIEINFDKVTKMCLAGALWVLVVSIGILILDWECESGSLPDGAFQMDFWEK